jgi:hypothetical protein
MTPKSGNGGISGRYSLSCVCEKFCNIFFNSSNFFVISKNKVRRRKIKEKLTKEKKREKNYFNY